MHLFNGNPLIWCFLVKNTEILRALQKASGLSPDAEPIKLLSVPKGALGKLQLLTPSQPFKPGSDPSPVNATAHSFVQRLRQPDSSSSRRHKLAQSMSR